MKRCCRSTWAGKAIPYYTFWQVLPFFFRAYSGIELTAKQKWKEGIRRCLLIHILCCTHLEWGLHPDLSLEGFDESVSGLTCRNWVRVANDVAQEICWHWWAVPCCSRPIYNLFVRHSTSWRPIVLQRPRHRSTLNLLSICLVDYMYISCSQAIFWVTKLGGGLGLYILQFDPSCLLGVWGAYYLL